MTSFYERLTTNLARLRAAEQHPPFRESLQALLDECQHQQAKILRICRRPPPAKAASAARKDTSPPETGSRTPPVPSAVDAAVRDGGGDRRPLAAPHRSRLRFSDVAGLEEAKASLAEAVIMPVQFPHLFTGGRRPWTRVLLYGPPGTGKSRLAAAVAGEAGAELFPVSAADLLSSYVGETEKAMSDLFARAASRQPAGRAVLFVDELDGLCRVRSGREEEHTRRLKTHLLQLMDGLLSGGGGGAAATTFLLAATNCPWDLDPAFLRRFQRRVYVPLPDRAAQRRLIELHLGGTATSLSELDWQQLLAGTDGLSGSDLAELTQHALYQPLRELETATSWRRLGDVGYRHTAPHRCSYCAVSLWCASRVTRTRSPAPCPTYPSTRWWRATCSSRISWVPCAPRAPRSARRCCGGTRSSARAAAVPPHWDRAATPTDCIPSTDTGRLSELTPSHGGRQRLARHTENAADVLSL
ncbi:vacuolar protein sorting-associated protein 4-like isoform X1 [Amphibalanus amphitrite]|uniref:vacuolar protein sorting-associated protein 4-like isoform X1 n=1 Tax=Amphibalanus amphitrite TaxID=1232801 RepID=UPI001C9113D4|nr:vacuolar protein sorting-associated protein 4-like isoform X1 [Amphibalanus amphitrite]